MIDLMDASIYSDFVYVWQFTADFQGMGDWLRGAVKTSNGYTSITRKQGQWQNGLESVLEKIKKLENASSEE